MRRLRFIALLAGLALLAWLVLRSGPARLLHDLEKIGWWMLALLLLAAVRNAARTEAVRLALGEDRREFSFGSMYAVLLVSGAVKFVAVAGLVVGEAAKGWLLNRRVSGPRAASAVLVDVFLYYFTAALFTLGAIALFFALFQTTRANGRAGIVAALAVVAVLALGVLAFRRRWISASRVLAPLARWGFIRRPETLRRVAEIDAELFGFRRRYPVAFAGILFFDFIAHFLAAAEVSAILWLLGFGAQFAVGVIGEGLTKIVGSGGLVVPGDVGIYQGGTGLIFHVLGYSVSTGVAIGIIRQIRSVLWAGIGFLALLVPGMGEVRVLPHRNA